MYHFTKPFVLCVIAFLTIFTGVICWCILFPSIIELKVTQGVVLEDESESLQRWLYPPTLDFKIYFFNVTNPGAVHIGDTPVVEEIGPYVYTEYHNKEVIEYHDDDTVSYNTRKIFFFNEEKSHPHKQTDVIVLMNPALMGIILMVEQMLPFALTYVNEAIPYLFNQTTIFNAATAQDLLFDGVRVNCTHGQGFGNMACNALKGRTPVTMRHDTNSSDYLFSFLHHKNDTTVGPFRVARGRTNPKELGNIKMYEEKNVLDVWPVNSTCNKIRGTDATIFPPFLGKTDPIYIYVPEVCGSLFAEFDSESSVGNIHVLKYVGSRNNFADPFKYSPNKCHCNGIERFQSIENVAEKLLICPKDGVMFLQKCHKAPIIFSEPHFYAADIQYINFVKGLRPNKTEHETFVEIEPMSGIPVEGHKRLQMNMFLKNVSDIVILENVNSGVMPLLWIEEGFKLGDEHMSILVTFYQLLTVLKFLPWILILGGIGILSYALFIIVSAKSILTCGKGSSCNKFNTVQNHVAENEAYCNDNNEIIHHKSISPQVEMTETYAPKTFEELKNWPTS